MKTTTSYKSDITRIINNASSDNSSWALEMINDSLRYLTTRYYFNERSFTVNTVSGQQFYNLPPQVKKLINVTVTIGGILWQARECSSRQYWDLLNTILNYQQNYPAFFFIYNGKLGIYPIPSSASDVITMNYKTRIVDLVQDDYTTGTVSIPYQTTTTAVISLGATSATLSSSWSLPTGTYQILFSNGNISTASFTNGSTAITWSVAITSSATATITVMDSLGGDIVTGSGTTFEKWMTSGYLMVPFSQTNGDQQWYPIGSYIDATHLSLTAPYTGGAVSGVTYTIGQTPILPEDYHDLPLYRMAYVYYTTRFPDTARAQLYKGLYDEGEDKLNEEFGSKTSSVAISDTDSVVQNPNLFQRQISQT